MQALAGNDIGRVLLWIAVLGFLGLGLWQVTEVIVGRGETSDRLKAAAKAVVYLFLAFSFFTYARGSSSSSSTQQSVDFTASLMDKPFGRILVGAVGVGDRRGRDLPHLQGREEEVPPGPARASGPVGRCAPACSATSPSGVAFGLVGVLFVLAALRTQPAEATGLDGALRTPGTRPTGRSC